MMKNATGDLVCFKDCNHVYTATSQTLASIASPNLNWSDLLGLTSYDVLPESLADQEYQLEQSIYSGQVAAQKLLNFTQENDTIWLDARKYQVTDSAGHLSGLFGIAYIITERIQTEQALALEKNHFRTLLN
ncbi:MAG: hypothetical protein COW14_02885, partial [Piscirickettsiaceae bacterium CG12_big_fil_rev_8_21_14_0_65_44_934]